MWGKPSNADRASTQGSDRVPSQKLSPTQESTDAHPVNSSWWATWGPTGTQPYPLYITLVAATGAIGVAVYRGLRRFPTVDYIPPRWIERHRPLRGYVVRISDSDNFRLYHAPPLWFGKIPPLHREYMKRTIHVRLAGVDAPESKFFSMPGQPYSAEAKAWVTKLLENKKVTVVPYAKDRYNRLLGMVYVRSWLFFKVNVSLRMVQAGYATVYKQHGAEYGGILEQLESAESLARARKRGMWAQNMKHYTSPAEHKRKYMQST